MRRLGCKTPGVATHGGPIGRLSSTWRGGTLIITNLIPVRNYLYLTLPSLFAVPTDLEPRLVTDRADRVGVSSQMLGPAAPNNSSLWAECIRAVTSAGHLIVAAQRAAFVRFNVTHRFF